MEVSPGLVWPLRMMVIFSTMWLIYAYYQLQQFTQTHTEWQSRIQLIFLMVFVGMASSIFYGELAYTLYMGVVGVFIGVLYTIITKQR